jgi:hypothetical protein
LLEIEPEIYRRLRMVKQIDARFGKRITHVEEEETE